MPWYPSASRNFSLAMTAVSGMVNSLTPSRGKCSLNRTTSPTSLSTMRLTTYKSCSYTSTASFSPSVSVCIYTPPCLPRKYGSGYGGMRTCSTSPSSSTISTRLSSSSASAISVPSSMGVLMTPRLGHPSHPSGLYFSNVLHKCGPAISSALRAVSIGS